MKTTLTIGERREELSLLSYRKLRSMFRRMEREYIECEWVDLRKRKDLIQAIINYEVGLGGRMR